MVGVANPLLRADRSAGRRFLWGFSAGLAASSLTLMLPLALLCLAVSPVSPEVRTGVLAVLLAMLGIADLADRTPHVWRQVPQRFARELPPGRLGFVWAYDLGLLVTTQKTTSLIWIGLAGLILTGPAHQVAVALTAIGAAFGLAVVVATVGRKGFALTDPRHNPRIRRGWIRPARFATGLVALAIAAQQAMELIS
jgi:hypothetical protein